jgi:hypothetical protein
MTIWGLERKKKRKGRGEREGRGGEINSLINLSNVVCKRESTVFFQSCGS